MNKEIVWHHHVLSAVPRHFGFTKRIISQHIVWYLTDGGIQLQLDENRIELGPGSLLWIPPGVSHSVSLLDQRKAFTCYSFRFEMNGGPSLPLVERNAHLQLPFIDALYKETCLGLQSDKQRCAALLYVIQTHSDDAVSSVQRRLSPTHCHRLHLYMRKHIQYHVSPADLAQHLGLSPDYFSRLFKRSFGKSPKRWLMEQRIAIAAYRLEQSSDSIAAIGRSCGYDDQNIFSRQFRVVMGCSPSAHRMRS